MFILTLINQTTRLPTQIIFTFCVFAFTFCRPRYPIQTRQFKNKCVNKLKNQANNRIKYKQKQKMCERLLSEKRLSRSSRDQPQILHRNVKC